MTKTYWCDECAKYVEPTVHHGVEPERFNGETTYELNVEYRCSICVGIVQERVACLECREAEPEAGTDHCSKCHERQEFTNLWHRQMAEFREIKSLEANLETARARHLALCAQIRAWAEEQAA